MKKLMTILFILAALICGGCEQTQEQIDASATARITEFNYKGHRYLRYYGGGGKYCYGGICHDPDCPCHEKGGEK